MMYTAEEMVFAGEKRPCGDASATGKARRTMEAALAGHGSRRRH
ncbi:MAG: hypothetical protein ACLR23_04410 [Clostridia bacterium]